MLKHLILGAAIAALASPVLAQGTTTTPATMQGSWAGPYFGAQAGYGWARDHIHDEERASPGFSDYTDHFNLNGATGGFFGGYNFQDGMWVFGAEADAEISSVDGNNAAWPFGTDMSARIAAQGSLRGRIGYVFDDCLFYATGGLALGEIHTHYYDLSDRDIYSNWRAGGTVGAGIEYAFTPQWTARIEYRYVDFGRVTDWTKNTDFGWNEHNDITEQAVRVGLGYRL